MRKLWLAGIGLGLIAAAAQAETLPGAVWQVLSIGQMDLTDADDATIEFDVGRIWGRSGCNRFSGGVTLIAVTPAAGTVTLGPVMSTRMACPGRGDQVEGAFLPALEQIDGYEVDASGDLVLTAGGAPRIRARRR